MSHLEVAIAFVVAAVPALTASWRILYGYSSQPSHQWIRLKSQGTTVCFIRIMFLLTWNIEQLLFPISWYCYLIVRIAPLEWKYDVTKLDGVFRDASEDPDPVVPERGITFTILRNLGHKNEDNSVMLWCCDDWLLNEEVFMECSPFTSHFLRHRYCPVIGRVYKRLCLCKQRKGEHACLRLSQWLFPSK